MKTVGVRRGIYRAGSKVCKIAVTLWLSCIGQAKEPGATALQVPFLFKDMNSSTDLKRADAMRDIWNASGICWTISSCSWSCSDTAIHIHIDYETEKSTVEVQNLNLKCQNKSYLVEA